MNRARARFTWTLSAPSGSAFRCDGTTRSSLPSRTISHSPSPLTSNQSRPPTSSVVFRRPGRSVPAWSGALGVGHRGPLAEDADDRLLEPGEAAGHRRSDAYRDSGTGRLTTRVGRPSLSTRTGGGASSRRPGSRRPRCRGRRAPRWPAPAVPGRPPAAGLAGPVRAVPTGRPWSAARTATACPRPAGPGTAAIRRGTRGRRSARRRPGRNARTGRPDSSRPR